MSLTRYGLNDQEWGVAATVGASATAAAVMVVGPAAPVIGIAAGGATAGALYVTRRLTKEIKHS